MVIHKLVQFGYLGVCSTETAFLFGVSRFCLSIVSSGLSLFDSYIYSCQLRLTLTFNVENLFMQISSGVVRRWVGPAMGGRYYIQIAYHY